MAEATSVEACVERHTAYPIDISRRLGGIQGARMKKMLAPVRGGDVVLDVGCNSGYIRRFLPGNCVVHGVDVAADLVKVAATRLHSASVAPAESLPFADRSVDVVVLGEILEHVYDPGAVLAEAARVSRRLVVGSTPHPDGKWGPRGERPPESHRYHVRCFTEGDLQALLDTHLDAVTLVPIRTPDGVAQMVAFSGQVRP